MAAAKKPPAESQTPADAEDPSRTEQLLARISRQLDLVILSRERIQETLDEAAERGRVTHTDANLLVSELVRRGRQQSEDLMRELESLVGRGREGIESATRLARRAVPGGSRRSEPELPIPDYDQLTARQVQERLSSLRPAQLRALRDHERRHANRKTVLEAIERALD